MAEDRHTPFSPFSVRFTSEEREQLDRAAAGMPLGAFLRSLIFDEDLLKKRRKPRKSPVKDHQVLARLQAELGQSRLANNLNQLAKAANCGSLEVSPDTEKALLSACADIRAMRQMLMEGLGIDPVTGSGSGP
ncbi:plasmid mobilization protein [Nitrospira sp. CMX1]|nr:plasmid mobilization relaxosome protein MobC [Nitrospira sp.]